jgi:hypothetical protein
MGHRKCAYIRGLSADVERTIAHHARPDMAMRRKMQSVVAQGLLAAAMRP